MGEGPECKRWQVGCPAEQVKWQHVSSGQMLERQSSYPTTVSQRPGPRHMKMNKIYTRCLISACWMDG